MPSPCSPLSKTPTQVIFNVINIFTLLPIAYKCFESSPEGLAIHADAAAVNLNLWITPDEANQDKHGNSGGLAVYLSQTLPKNWTFQQMNQLGSNIDSIRSFLKETNSSGVMTRPIWQLMFKLPMYQHCQIDSQENARFLEERIVNIPSSVR